ncbi:M48 family metallopeptidase [Halovulum sp. GXIMD14794]
MRALLRRAEPVPPVIELDDPHVTVAIRQSARAKRLTLRLASGTGRLTLTVPRGVPVSEMRRFLHANRQWIESRTAALPDVQVPAPGLRLTVGGEQLTLRQGRGRRIIRQGDEVFVPGDDARFLGAVQGWLKERMREEARASLDRYSGALGLPYARLTLRDPRSRWGSCTSEGNIMLSWRLILAPPNVLDYVAAHEVAHLAEMNHSPGYWRTLAGLLPGYEEPRQWLRAHGAQLHRYRFQC